MVFRKASTSITKLVCIAAIAAIAGANAGAQNVPLLSGGVGFLSNTTGGVTTLEPVMQPLIAAPVGSRVLVESRGELHNLYTQNATGDYKGNFGAGLAYLQADVFVAPHVTVVAGKFLLPFNTYNERLTPLWVPRLNEAPLIAGVGLRTSGAGIGGELRGALLTGAKAQLNYNAYFSANSSVPKFNSARVAGGQAAVFVPGARLEMGFSYQRFLQQTHLNNFGAHVWWLPPGTGFQLRSEYAHGPNSQGYWVETAYRLSRFGGVDSVVGRMEPVFRMQQTFRNRPNPPGQGDGAPGVDTKQADFGFSYHLPAEVRLTGSYAREFAATNKNLWDVSLTYRFLFPMWRGRK